MSMRKTILLPLSTALAVALLAGCGIVYKPDVQQGNLLDGRNVQQLKPGMSKEQVLALLGSPSVTSPFSQNRWDYVATMQRRGGKILERSLTLYFSNDTLVRTDGDFLKETPQELLQESKKYGPLYPSNLTKEEQEELEKKAEQGSSSGSDGGG
ncbi:MAG TPA: outer membrane protein assembly factor BamE [Rhodanobacteraceae bacterium]|nr:outer membrane protein assembly factor BamE [Rhodanobacteraceae bacterium]